MLIGLCSLSLVALGVVFHALTCRSYPHRPPPLSQAFPQAATPAMLCAPDFDEALAQMGESFDIAREDLDRRLQYAEAKAMRRQPRFVISAVSEPKRRI